MPPHIPRTASPINYRLGILLSVFTGFLLAVQEPFSFLAARRLNTIQFVCLTQIALLISIPLLMLRPATHRDFLALFRDPSNYGRLAVILAIGMSGLLLYNFGLSNAHPIIISAILNLLPFWAAVVALIISRVPIPVSPTVFFGCFTGAFIGAMAIAWSQLSETDKPTISQLAEDFAHGGWLYATPVPIFSALGGTLIGRWFAKYEELAAIAANFFVANVILIPATLLILHHRSELQFGDQFVAVALMIIGTIIAASVGRVFYQISLTVKLAFGDQSGELRQDPGVPRLLAALGLDTVLLRGGEIDDRVDAVLGHAQFDRQIHVAAAMAVDERVETELAQPVGQALAVGHSLDAVLREPSVIGGARDADHLRAGPPGELDHDRADAARRGRHRNRVAGFERYGMHRGIGRAASDRERSRDLPGDPRWLRRQIPRLRDHVFGVARPLVGETDHLVADLHAPDPRAHLRHDSGEV